MVERHRDRVADRLDASGRRFAAAQPAGQHLGGVGKAFGHELVLAVADAPQGASFGHDPARESDRTGGRIAVDDLVDDAVGERLARLDRVA